MVNIARLIGSSVLALAVSSAMLAGPPSTPGVGGMAISAHTPDTWDTAPTVRIGGQWSVGQGCRYSRPPTTDPMDPTSALALVVRALARVCTALDLVVMAMVITVVATAALSTPDVTTTRQLSPFPSCRSRITEIIRIIRAPPARMNRLRMLAPPTVQILILISGRSKLTLDQNPKQCRSRAMLHRLPASLSLRNRYPRWSS